MNYSIITAINNNKEKMGKKPVGLISMDRNVV
jgi:hypothetical protein